MDIEAIKEDMRNIAVWSPTAYRHLTNLLTEVARLQALELRVSAFAGQLQAWGADEAARELLKEIIGGTVVAPDYYALQQENVRIEATAQTMRTALAACADDLEAYINAEYRGMLDYPHNQVKLGRDMEPVIRARAAMALLDAPDA